MNICYLDDAITGELLIFFRDQAGLSIPSLLQAQKAVRNTLFSIVAYDNGNAVGIGRLVGDGALIWYIQDLIVLPGYQKRGIGSAVMERLMDFAVKNSVPDSVVSIGLLSSKGKEAFYEKLGFRIRPNDAEGAGMIAIKKI